MRHAARQQVQLAALLEEDLSSVGSLGRAPARLGFVDVLQRILRVEEPRASDREGEVRYQDDEDENDFELERSADPRHAGRAAARFA